LNYGDVGLFRLAGFQKK